MRGLGFGALAIWLAGTSLAAPGATDAAALPYLLVTLDFPPLEYTDASGRAAGAAVELVRLIMQQLGRPSEIEVLPWARALGLAKAGKVDGVFTAYRNVERESYLDFTDEPLIDQPICLYVRKGSTLKFRGNLKELTPHVIGILPAVSYGNTFDRAKVEFGLKTERADSLESSLKQLLAGRVDYVISNRYSAQAEIERLGFASRISELTHPVEVTPSFVAFTKKHHDEKLTQAFDMALLSLKRSGQYAKVLAKFKLR